ncbi:MAG TPA: iron ABC transporter permease [Bacillota bacterium]|nr:iron ABC transporter permease [Bacillota bacterium]
MRLLRDKWQVITMPVLLVLFLITGVLSLGTGAVEFNAGEVVRAVIAGLNGQMRGLEITPRETIIFYIRLPRVILAAMTGAALAASGAVYQGIFRNPMADPYVMGTSAGASLGATCAFMLPINIRFLSLGSVPLLAFAGSLVAVMLVYGLAKVGDRTPVLNLLLSGMIVSSILSAIVSLMMFVMPTGVLHGLAFWLMGGFSGRGWSNVAMITPYFILGLSIVLVFSRDLNALLLGDEPAMHLGIEVSKVTKALIVAASLLTACAVSSGGIIGFVGLVIPHVLRMCLGPDNRRLVPASLIFGATVMMAADAVARIVIAPQELPVGIITALCGGPFFVYLLRQYKTDSYQL